MSWSHLSMVLQLHHLVQSFVIFAIHIWHIWDIFDFCATSMGDGKRWGTSYSSPHHHQMEIWSPHFGISRRRIPCPSTIHTFECVVRTLKIIDWESRRLHRFPLRSSPQCYTNWYFGWDAFGYQCLLPGSLMPLQFGTRSSTFACRLNLFAISSLNSDFAHK